ncbi:MAG: hypothetical protein RR216_08085, partial [Pseudoflavonifractor sp.]
FRSTLLTTTTYQKNLSVYVEDRLIYTSVVPPVRNAADTPGSGKVAISLPPDSAGQTIRMEYEHVILSDGGPVPTITLQDGVGKPFLMIPNGNYLFFIVSAIFLVGVVLLLLSVALVGIGVKLAPILYLAIFYLSSSMWIMCNSKIFQFFTDNLVLMHNLEYMSFYLLPLALWSFLWSNWHCYPKISACILTVTGTFFALAITLKAFGILDFYYLLPVFHVLLALSIATFAVVAVMVFRGRDFSLKLFFLGFAQLCFCGLVDLVRYYTVFTPESMAGFFVSGVLLMGVFILSSFLFSTRDRLRDSIEREMYKTLAFTDVLTGISNRLRFEADLKDLEGEQCDRV